MPQELLRAIVPAAGYYSEPGNYASLETEVLFGERVVLLETGPVYLRVQSSHYASPGFVRKEEFEPHASGGRLTHCVIAPEANLYREPGFKPGVKLELPFNAQLIATGARQETPAGAMLEFISGWMFEDQVCRLNKPLKDYAEVARSRVNAGPYTWGGRKNPDCSALVMDALLVCGILCPRNVGEQAKSLGVLVRFDETFSRLKKGDFVFWTDPSTKGRHVVIMTSPTECVHATIAEPHRRVVEQPLADVIRRQEEDGNGRPTLVRRFPNYRF